MNVLVAIPYFGGLKDGNPDVVDLALELGKRGHTVIVLTARYGNEALYEELNGVRIFRIRPVCYLSKIDYGVSFPFLKLHSLIRKHRIDVVHGVMEFGTQTLSAMVISSVFEKPFVLTIQGGVTTFASARVDALFSLVDYGIVRRLSFIPKKVIILSKNLLERACKIGIPRSKIQVIPSGIHYENDFNPKLFDRDKVREEFGFENKTVVGFVGRLVRLKGLFFLLHAQKMLQQQIPNLHLLIIGEGPEKSLVESTAKRLNLSITMTGWVRRNDVPRLLSGIDIFVNPSLTEGLPISVMEAMAMQKPVVATDVGGTSDLINNGEDGFLIPPCDVKSLVKAIKTLTLNSDLRLNMGRAGRAIIEKNFRLSTVVSKVEKVYEEAIR